MTFLAPWALWAASAVSAAVIALHVLASKNPRVTPLPTARFIPDVPLRATARALRLSDVALMILRVATVMLAGVAFARPELTGARRAVGRVVMVDRSRVADRKAAEDSSNAYVRNGDLSFIFDSTAYELPVTRNGVRTADGGLIGSEYSRGSLSAGLAAAMRAASSLRGDADSIEIVLISPFAVEEFDAATAAIRAAWPGRLRVVRTALSGEARPTRAFTELRGASPNDPLRAVAALSERLDTGRIKIDSVLIERGRPSNADTMWTQHGLPLIRWPAFLDSSGFPARAHSDTAGAVVAGEGENRVVVVAPFVRAVDPPPGRVVARWADGAAAATERTVMTGCVRDVAIPLPRVGDLALRESMRRFIAALSARCHGLANFTLASDSAIAQLRGTGPLVATRALATRAAPLSHLATWLLASALALLLIEPLLRRQRATA